MADEAQAGSSPTQSDVSKEDVAAKPAVKWTKYLGLRGKDSERLEERWAHREKWSMGILSDKETEEVPGTILLLAAKRNEPLGLRQAPARTSATSLPSPYPPSRASSQGPATQSKRTPDGNIVLDPQPEESMNDPLNWPVWRRDLALLCLGFYCMLGGGMTPILAAAYNEVSVEYGISFHKVALTTGLYMLGLGLGSVVMSPTAILYGKRPVYIAGATMFILSAVWCALSPTYISLVIARIFQGLAVSPVECLPSATIAEIYFLHERAYRVGIYTLLLLGGKNLIPLVSAAITNSLGWRWIFWIVAITTGFGAILVFFFVPETFWDRTPRLRTKRPNMRRSVSDLVHGRRGRSSQPVTPAADEPDRQLGAPPAALKKQKDVHVGFADAEKAEAEKEANPADYENDTIQPQIPIVVTDPEAQRSIPVSRDQSADPTAGLSQQQIYTSNLRAKPPVSFVQSLKPWNGRIAKDNWFRVMVRPFILFAYPAVLWSSMVYALSVGWLIVLSESVAEVYANRDAYNFTPLQVGLVYISPFVAGILGTIVAGRVSDIIVRFMSRRNGGVYEPEFRLVMAIPITLATTIGLMGFGWSAQERDNWIVPTVFFGVLSFGCTLGSTTAITFCVDSYRQYAGEALVTLNFSKNVLHGFIFSLFFVQWLQADGAKMVFIALGGIHLALMLFSIPMYIYGKRARMWTVRKRLMEKF
ncbi:member of major facilitator superfamily multidrug-resistance protein [Arthroderma uncinatum]|uniref:member of major facilitator superfamily multidrug-resistance protein n=1 Tax=Arthroderma uncinatum TaxID=74035 RepID=UPI00144AF53A|nr:member of major facilitator superfamily multidrug-resistance protein [Arthroderma uncinatum]KAF3482283.1 member of major facilitator superfamily multidrug-resistance protein [Arthroderma uncinatum]